jgi:hypothetical protein
MPAAALVSVWEQFDAVLEGCEAGVRLESQSETAWAGELWVLTANPEAKPARSMTFYAIGSDPEHVARRLLSELAVWRSEGGSGMPVQSGRLRGDLA